MFISTIWVGDVFLILGSPTQSCSCVYIVQFNKQVWQLSVVFVNYVLYVLAGEYVFASQTLQLSSCKLMPC